MKDYVVPFGGLVVFVAGIVAAASGLLTGVALMAGGLTMVGTAAIPRRRVVAS